MGQIWVPIAAIAHTKNDQHAFFSGQAQEEGERPEEAVVQVGNACAELPFFGAWKSVKDKEDEGW